MAKTKMNTETCYMCDSEATTKEHAPPYCFFPETHRANLVTVPSCPKHNNDNSKDVEYVRNVVVSHINTNALGRVLFQKALRSYQRSPKLFRQIFKKVNPIMVGGRETAVVKLNLTRFKIVMRAIANALYFRDFNTPYPYWWWIYGASFVSEGQGFYGLPDNVNPPLREAFRRLAVTDKDTNQPEVFKYAIYQDDKEQTIYKMEFYEGVLVYAVGFPDNEEGK
jgi:hypothetical protein